MWAWSSPLRRVVHEGFYKIDFAIFGHPFRFLQILEVSGKETRVGAHRGGGATVGWRREFSATAVGDGGSPDGGQRCPEALPRLCKSEGGVRAEPKWEKWGAGGARGSSHLGEGTTSVVRPNSRWGAALRQWGRSKKQRGGGFCPWGASDVGRRRGKETRRGGIGRCPFEAEAGKAGEGWGVRALPREGGRRRGVWLSGRARVWRGRAAVCPAWQRGSRGEAGGPVGVGCRWAIAMGRPKRTMPILI
jgi:hypothetical protein